ncbi:MAG: DUF4140 domain-containing protein [Verrucomicrobia bacterium]|nr:DUF4140 domain-containing protein [Verrucomicrobiota bacterium]MDA1067169.1 DUF4140 domain-containing protein [Verrucomicrobiota bacterium]
MNIKRFLLIGMAIYAFSQFLHAQTLIDSRITEVYVYTGSARVTRLADLDLLAGENVLRFSGLPTNLDVNQIQVGLVDGVPIRLDNLMFQQIKDRENTDIEETTKASIEELRSRIQVINAQKSD